MINDPQLVTKNNIIVEGAGLRHNVALRWFAASPNGREPRAPASQHKEILREIGFDAGQIAGFAERNVISGGRRKRPSPLKPCRKPWQ